MKMRLRLGRTAWLVLGIGVFVIAFATLFMFYFHCSGEQAELEKSLTGAQTQLAGIVSGRAALESRLADQENKLAAANALLNNARASFPRSNANIEYDEVLADLAQFHNLEVVSMKAAEPRETKVGDITFIVISFEAEVSGAVNSILGMVHDIAEDALFASATVEVVNLKVPEPAAAGEEPAAPSATIKLVGYSYGGE
jgi:hypothetical protein